MGHWQGAVTRLFFVVSSRANAILLGQAWHNRAQPSPYRPRPDNRLQNAPLSSFLAPKPTRRAEHDCGTDSTP